MMAKRIGIVDVAAAAGVSVTTVSHALNGRGQVNPATRERVQRIAAELGYAPNRIATALRNRRSGIIGFVSDEIATTPYSGRVILGAQDAADERGMLLVMVDSNGDPEVETRQILALRAQQVDAIVYARMYHQAVSVPSAIGDLPTVLVDAVDQRSTSPSVVPDEVGIGRDGTAYLIAMGHRNIVHLTIDDRGPGHDGRIVGYREVMHAHGLDPRIASVPSPADGRAGFDALRLAISDDERPTAVFCFNDEMALGVYQSARELGISVPDELSVMGVDDFTPIAAQLRPGLTTIALPHYEMGRWAIRTLADLIDGVEPPEPHLRMPAGMVVRDSVVAPSLQGGIHV
jgi:LacI family transcriptional regulator